MNRFSFSLSALALAVSFVSSPVLAAEAQSLLQGEKIAITAEDVRADALRMPEEMRNIVLAKPETVTQIASNLYARRAMAQQAETLGLANDPSTVAALQVARDKVLSDALLAKVEKDNMPSDEAAEALARNKYKVNPERFQTPEQVRVSHILIAGKEAAAREKAEKILSDLKGGADFSALAKEHSADPGSAAKGGDLGFFAKGRMVPEFDAVAFALKNSGDVSDIVETQFGFHVLKLGERKPAGQRPFEEVRDELVKEVQKSVLQEARALEAQKMQQDAKLNPEAVKAFSAGYEGKAPAPKKLP